MTPAPETAKPVLLPDAPALVAGIREAVLLTPDGEIETLSPKAAAERLNTGPAPLVCHAAQTAARLQTAPFPAFDLLELFAFIYPARFCLPSPRGLAEALMLPLPMGREREAESLFASAAALLGPLDGLTGAARREAASIARAMALGRWSWGAAVLAALGETPQGGAAYGALQIWNALPEWEDGPPEPPPGSEPVEPFEARRKLAVLLGANAEGYTEDWAEDRAEQADYAEIATAAFLPREREDEPHLVLAEAGTGVGKTLGYIAPSALWAERNKGPVWISTFTRNLQRQLDAELDRLYPDPEVKEKKAVIRKGRENYFCLLNFHDALNRLPQGDWVEDGKGSGRAAAALGLMARWALASRDGDMVGGDFPAWLAPLLGRELTLGLTDTRGECVFSICEHYNKCFIERTARRAKRAEIVVANHALVMIQAALGTGDEAALPVRYVFDEGHHLFDAADGAFSAHLTGMEAADLRRWLLGAEGGGRSRSRGLKKRIEDLARGSEKAQESLGEVLRAARVLPGTGWRRRLADDEPLGPLEAFLARLRAQVRAREAGTPNRYSLECEARPHGPGLIEAAGELGIALGELAKPVTGLYRALGDLLDDETAELDGTSRSRIESVRRGLNRRGRRQIEAWRSMLLDLKEETPPEFVDWFGIERMDGRDLDVGFHRHWIDPTRPFAEAVLKPAHGVLVTSATLKDCAGDGDGDWISAEERSGAAHLASGPVRASLPSPFDYAGRTRVFVVGDVDKNDPAQVGSAMRELFLAAGGGGLGLFTAITRLRAIHQRIAGPLEESGLNLLAQHVDGMDTGTLIDLFRAEEDSCLLGTDAVRDGVDVPGRSLRLIVFDRVPWPRPDILHKARRAAFGGRAFDEMLTRRKLKQAYGRLIRRADDRGVFVMLDRGLPSRLTGAFPAGVEVRRLGIAEAVAETRAFLSGDD